MRAWQSSARTRLTLWYSGVMGATLLGLAFGLYWFARASWRREVAAQLADDAATLTYTLIHQPGELAELEEHGLVPTFLVGSADTASYASAAWRHAGLAAALSTRHGRDLWQWVAPGGRPFSLKAGTVSAAEGVRGFVVARDARLMERSLRSLAIALLLSTPAVLALASLGGYFLAGRVLAPTRAMAARAQLISADRLSERLPVAEPRDEFGRLAAVFNDLLSRLEASFAQLKRFTADASHELRTPLTAIRSVGEVGLQRERTVEGLRGVIGSILEESDRLTRLVEALLAITRAESPTTRLALAPLELRHLAADVVEEIRVLAEEKGQTLTVRAGDQVSVQGDGLMLRHAVINLVDNAIKYTPAGGAIDVAIGERASGDAYIEVSDNGPGIAAEQHQAVFQRFYRAQPEHADRPGVGLGLALVQRVAELHGGRVELESERGRGSAFRLVFPQATRASSRGAGAH